MDSEARIVFDHVWKKFHRGASHDSLRDLIPSVARRLLGRAPAREELEADDFWAVRDVSFEVRPGQTLGIIGPNGSGKSTTLRMLTKILAPSRGRTEVRGRLGALIEVSAGFHGDLTGRENTYLQGAIMGMRTRDVAARFDEIVEFSGIADFIDTPVKRYSSGMNARLGFSIAAHLEPDVLVIDEVLAVGDMQFQERAYGRIRELASSGRPVVIVSHQLDRVADLCTEAILLRRGAVVYHGSPAEAIDTYFRTGAGAQQETAQSAAPVEFTSVRLLDDRPVTAGDWCALRVEGRVLEPVPDHVEPLHISVRSLKTGRTLFMCEGRALGVELPARGTFALRLELQANVYEGSFFVIVSAKDMRTQTHLTFAPPAMMQVVPGPGMSGTHVLNPRFAVLDTA